MTIDLKWGLPFAFPVILLGFMRFMFWLAGGEWSEPSMAAAFSALFGMGIGFFLAVAMHEAGIRWDITIGGKRDQ
jgi:hypothetical protein